MSDAPAGAATAGNPAQAPTDPSQTASADGTKPGAGGPSTPQFKGTKHKIVADGQELELDYDEMLKLASHGRAANKRFQEAAELRKTAQAERAVVDAVVNGNWRPLIEKVGVEKAKAFAEDFLTQYLEWQEMPEDKRARIMAEQERDAAKEQLSKREKAEQDAAAKKLEAKVGGDLETEIGDALKAAGYSADGKRPTPRLIMRIAEQMHANLEAQDQGQEAPRLAASEALNRAVSGIHHDIAEFLSPMSGEQLLKTLPGPVLDVLRKAFADEVLAQDPFRDRSGQQTEVHSEQKSRRRSKVQGTDSFFKNLEKRYAR